MSVVWLQDTNHYKLLATRIKKSGIVSVLHHFFLDASYYELPLDRIWRYDCPNLGSDFDWSQVWANIRQTSCNPDHQQIHYINYVHRTYLTPLKLHSMKVITDPLCSLCSMKASGTSLHMMWNCPPVSQFWFNVASQAFWFSVSDHTTDYMPVLLLIFILNLKSALY